MAHYGTGCFGLGHNGMAKDPGHRDESVTDYLGFTVPHSLAEGLYLGAFFLLEGSI